MYKNLSVISLLKSTLISFLPWQQVLKKSDLYKIPAHKRFMPIVRYTFLSCILILLSILSVPYSSAHTSSTGHLAVRVKDGTTGRNTPVRVKLSRNGYAVNKLPQSVTAVMYGLWDHGDGYGFQPDSSFYTDGLFSIDLPPGTYELAISKGNEYLSQKHTLKVEAGKRLRKTFTLRRWINTPAMGWYSADGHMHIRRSPREDALLSTWIQAEDVHVGVILRMGDFWEIYYPQYAWGEKGLYHQDDYMIVSGQEDPRTPELGHILSLGADNRVRMKEEYYYYDHVLDSLKALDGLSGYAHGGEAYHGYRGLILDGLRNKVDYLEILQYCISDQPLMLEHYYHLLDMGFPLTALAGSDFPWCGKDHSRGKPEKSAQIGNARFYTYTGNTLTFESWKEGIRKGHTFVSSGPILDFKVNNRLPGEKIEADQSTMLTITAHAYGHSEQQPLQSLEIVGHGKVLARVRPNEANQSTDHLSIEFTLPAGQGIWLAARCYAADNTAAHTTPVYVSVDGKGFHNPATMSHYINLSEKYLQELEEALQNKSYEAEYQLWRYRSGLLQRIAETRQILQNLKEKTG